jgi:hypothetical protein
MKSSEIIFEVTESLEGGYEARALSASIFTEAETLPELESAVRDAVRCHFDEGQTPAVIRLHLVRDLVIPA